MPEDDSDEIKNMGRLGYNVWLGAIEAGASPLEAMFVTAALFRGMGAADNFEDEPPEA